MSEDKRKKANGKKITLPKASEIYHQKKVLYAHASAAVGAIAKRVAPGGRVQGQYWAARDPQRPQDHRENLSINLTDGKWRIFGTEMKGGDVISFVAYVSGIDDAKAEAAVRSMLGEPVDKATDED